MIEFKWAYAIILLPIPLIMILIRYLKDFLLSGNPNNTHTKPNQGLNIPFYNEIINISNTDLFNNKFSLSRIFNFVNLLKMILWLSFILAMMRPIWLGDPMILPTPTHDIIMAIDISGSMQSDDMSTKYQITRLDVVKQIGHQFIAQRNQDRIGLVFFGSLAFVSSPLTLDQDSLHNFLEKTQVGFAGQKTAIGDAIGLAVKRIAAASNNKNNKGFIILLSDGSNNSGKVDPIDAANVAAKHDIKIYTIGIGKTSNHPLDIMSGMSLDEKTLKAIASITNGKYFHATSKQALADIYNQINALEPNNEDSKTLRPETEWFIYPLLITLLACVLLFAIKNRNHEPI